MFGTHGTAGRACALFGLLAIGCSSASTPNSVDERAQAVPAPAQEVPGPGVAERDSAGVPGSVTEDRSGTESQSPESPAAVRHPVDDLAWLPHGLDRLDTPSTSRDPSTVARAELGRHLFFETGWSSTGSESCASCHDPRRAFADGTPTPANRPSVRVNTPSLLGASAREQYGWDGASDRRDDFLFDHLFSERGLALDDELRALEALDRSPTYRRLFEQGFGVAPSLGAASEALGEFTRQIVAPGSAFDRWMAGDRSALEPQQKDGLALFLGEASCVECHEGRMFSDDDFHRIGTFAADGASGRFDVTGRNRDLGRFRTPSLRDVSRTAPYLHDGSAATLADAIRAHSRLEVPEVPALSDAQIEALVAFLHALDGEVPVVAPPTRSEDS